LADFAREDVVLNLFLLLYAIESASQRGRLYGRVKLQKLLFEAERRMNNVGLRAFAYVFRRWEHGPYSLEADQGLDWLVKNGLVNLTDESIKTTATGQHLLKEARELLEKNREVLAIIDRVSEVHAPDTGKIMKAMAYGTSAPISGKLIRDVEKGEILLQPLDRSRASKLFLVDTSWIETLEILLDKESRQAIEEAMSDAGRGRITRYRPAA